VLLTIHVCSRRNVQNHRSFSGLENIDLKNGGMTEETKVDINSESGRQSSLSEKQESFSCFFVIIQEFLFPKKISILDWDLITGLVVDEGSLGDMTRGRGK